MTPHHRDALFLQPGPAFFQVNYFTKLAFFNGGSFGLENVDKKLLKCLNWHLKLTPPTVKKLFEIVLCKQRAVILLARRRTQDKFEQLVKILIIYT